MKKIIALMLALMMVIFAGCTSENTTEEKKESKETSQKTTEKVSANVNEEEQKNEKKASVIKENTEDSEDATEEPTSESVSVEIDDSWLALMGKTQDEIVRIKGALSDNDWADGPLYRFGSENVWYSFEGYDFAEDNNYIPLGSCTGVGVPLDMLLETEGNCDAQALENAVGNELTQGFDIMYECNTYSVTYNGYRFVIYEDSASAISGQSVVNIEKE